MPQDNTKQRAGRITDRTYFRRSDRLTATKNILSILAILAGLAFLCWGLVINTSGDGAWLISPGPVTSVHATWNNRCDACHEPHANIQSRDRCATCHGGPLHFKDQEAAANRCASCHSEHHGTEADLLRPSNAACIGCHRDLSFAKKPLGVQQVITEFTLDHPLQKAHTVTQFEPARDRTLKFSHHVHLTEGISWGEGNPRQLHFRDINDKAAQQRLHMQDESELVKLRCDACHALDGGDDLSNLDRNRMTSRAAGGNPLPVTYEKNCKACHALELTVERQSLTIPHPMQPDRLREFLYGIFTRSLLEKHQLPADRLRIDAGGRLDRSSEQPLQQTDEVIEKLVSGAEIVIAPKCGMCHVFDGVKAPFAKQSVRPLRTLEPWFERARFTHVPHRAVQCESCHDMTRPDLADPITQREGLERPILPEIGKCKDCHSPASSANGRVAGGARSDCVECHIYHHGSPWNGLREINLRGIGAEARGVAARQDVQAFLHGEPAAAPRTIDAHERDRPQNQRNGSATPAP